MKEEKNEMKQNYILGGYTKKANDGLYQTNFDPETLIFTNTRRIAELTNPTFATLSENKKLLFALYQGEELGGVIAFEKTDGGWKELDRIAATEKMGSHIEYRDETRTIYVSNYHEGALDVYSLDKDNNLWHIQRENHDQHPDTSNVHYAGVSRDGTMLFVADLGQDTVSTYGFKEDGQITLLFELALPKGSGPRHIVQHPNAPVIYVITELSSEIYVLRFSVDGKLDIVQQLDILHHASRDASSAAIKMTSNGQYLYTSTRYDNRLASFLVSQQDGTLEKIAEVSAEVKVPRDFTLDESQRYLLVPDQDSNQMAIFERDLETGELHFIKINQTIPECVCILPNY